MYFVRTLNQLLMNFLQTSLWTSYKVLYEHLTNFFMNFLRTSYQLLKNFLSTSYELLMNFLWTSYELLMNFLWTSNTLLANFFMKFFTNFLRASYRLLVALTSYHEKERYVQYLHFAPICNFDRKTVIKALINWPNFILLG